MPVPPPVVSAIDLRTVGIRRFQASPFHEAACLNCSWRSFVYATEDEAAERGEKHAVQCCARLNAELALQCPGVETLAENLQHGDYVLMRDLRTMWIENISLLGDEVIVTYDRGEPESEIMVIPVGHPVKVVQV